MTPQRIQRRRTKGWRMPEGAVYVGRPGRWGNPYVVGHNALADARHLKVMYDYVTEATR